MTTNMLEQLSWPDLRKLAKEKGIAIHAGSGSGPRSRADIEKDLEQLGDMPAIPLDPTEGPTEVEEKHRQQTDEDQAHDRARFLKYPGGKAFGANRFRAVQRTPDVIDVFNRNDSVVCHVRRLGVMMAKGREVLAMQEYAKIIVDALETHGRH
jgi:pyruvate/2-oxoglutarate dehydrogenase complex dihydrolipoamide acyltransferase (E2) component